MINDKKDERVILNYESQIKLTLIQNTYRDLHLAEPAFEEIINTIVQKYADVFISDMQKQIRMAKYRASLDEDDADEDEELDEDEDL